MLAAVDAGVDVGRRRDRADAGLHLAAQPRRDRRGAAPAPSANRARPASRWSSCSDYWEAVRRYYAPFETDMRAGTADVYRHEMPGGQYTNLRQQARALGLERRWPEVAQAYADVNQLFGDIVKVTPTSKVVGDMALFMVANDLTPEEILDPDREIAFPESVVELFDGDLGQPPGGFPEARSSKVLKGEPPLTERPGEACPTGSGRGARGGREAAAPRHQRPRAGGLPDVPEGLPRARRALPAPRRRQRAAHPIFFYGLRRGDEISSTSSPARP